MTRSLPLCVALACAALAAPAMAGATNSSRSCDAALTPALQQLLDWPHDVWRFAVAEHLPSGRFVQFGYDQGLFLDLPTQALSADEQRAVRVLFEKTGGGGPRRMQATDADGAPIEVDTLHRHFGADGDAATAAGLGCRVMTEVFGVPDDAPLEITVDGD
jgi:hypothetical protein